MANVFEKSRESINENETRSMNSNLNSLFIDLLNSLNFILHLYFEELN